MNRAGRVLAALAMVVSLTFIIGALGSVGGCSSGSTGTIEQASKDEAADKVGQDKMKEFMQNKPSKSSKRK